MKFNVNEGEVEKKKIKDYIFFNRYRVTLSSLVNYVDENNLSDLNVVEFGLNYYYSLNKKNKEVEYEPPEDIKAQVMSIMLKIVTKRYTGINKITEALTEYTSKNKEEIKKQIKNTKLKV